MRTIVATLVMLAIAYVLDAIPTLDVTARAPDQNPALQLPTALLGFIAGFFGGLISKKPYFPLVSMATYILLWFISIDYAHGLLPELTFAEILLNNRTSIANSICAVGIGGLLGYGLPRSIKTNRTEA